MSLLTGNTTEILARKVVRAYDARNRIDTFTIRDNNSTQAWDHPLTACP